jgi:hypothetical protein
MSVRCYTPTVDQVLGQNLTSTGLDVRTHVRFTVSEPADTDAVSGGRGLGAGGVGPESSGQDPVVGAPVGGELAPKPPTRPSDVI